MLVLWVENILGLNARLQQQYGSVNFMQINDTAWV